MKIVILALVGFIFSSCTATPPVTNSAKTSGSVKGTAVGELAK